MARIYAMLFDTLIVRDWANGGALVPGLASAWEQVDDTTINFTPLEGVVVHDGTPFTADDVKFTLGRSLESNAHLFVTGRFPIRRDDGRRRSPHHHQDGRSSRHLLAATGRE